MEGTVTKINFFEGIGKVEQGIKGPIILKGRYKGAARLLFKGREPIDGGTTKFLSVTHGQCDARQRYYIARRWATPPLAGTKLYCLVTEAHAGKRSTCPRLLPKARRPRGKETNLRSLDDLKSSTPSTTPPSIDREGGMILSNGVGTNFGLGGRRGEARTAESGDGVLGEGQPAPPTG